MSRLLCLIVACGYVAVAGVTISSYDQGAKFDKCVSNADFEGKTLADDITLLDRDANGCCPAGSVPGAQHSNAYIGAQIICGFKSDGTVKMSTTKSNKVKTSCTYNQCYVYKQNLACKTAGAKQRLNGCCKAAADCKQNNCDFGDNCKNYIGDVGNNVGEDVHYCRTYHKTYKMEYTSIKTDDQANDKLQVGKLYVYTACAGSAIAGGGSGGGGDEVKVSGSPLTAPLGAVATTVVALATWLQ
jgi:hypothetical protein